MRFDWDPVKAALNYRKHRVRFSEAQTIFSDPFVRYDESDPVSDESRLVALGESAEGHLLFVAYAWRGEDCIRIISARRADKAERRAFEETKQ